MAKAHRHSVLVASRIVPIALALLLAACVFIYLVRLRRVSIGADDYGYLSYARSIVEYKSLRMHYPPIEKLLESADVDYQRDPIAATVYIDGRLTSKMPIGYPLLLALMMKIMGQDAVYYATTLFILPVMALFYLLTVRALSPENKWLGATLALAALLGGFKYFFLFSLAPLKEMPALLFMAAGLYFALSAFDKAGPRKWKLTLYGFLMGYACATRETLLPMAIICSAAIIYRLSTYHFRKAVRCVASLAVPFTATFSLHLIRSVINHKNWMKINIVLPNWSFFPIFIGGPFLLWGVFRLLKRRPRLEKWTVPSGQWAAFASVEVLFLILLTGFFIGTSRPELTKGIKGLLPHRIIQNSHAIVSHYGIAVLGLIMAGCWWAVNDRKGIILLSTMMGGIYLVSVTCLNPALAPRFLLPVHFFWAPGVAAGFLFIGRSLRSKSKLAALVIIPVLAITVCVTEWMLLKTHWPIWNKLVLLSVGLFVISGALDGIKSYRSIPARVIGSVAIFAMAFGAFVVVKDSQKKKEKAGYVQMEHMRMLRRDLKKVLPPGNTVILAYRYLCQNLDMHTGYYSFSPDTLKKSGIETAQLCSLLMSEGYRVAIIDNRGVKYDARPVVQRLKKNENFQLNPLLEIDPGKYNAKRRILFGRNKCTLYEIKMIAP